MSDEIVQALNRIAKALEDNAANGRENLELNRNVEARALEYDADRKARDEFDRAKANEIASFMAGLSMGMRQEAERIEERFKIGEANTDARLKASEETADRRQREYEERIFGLEKRYAVWLCTGTDDGTPVAEEVPGLVERGYAQRFELDEDHWYRRETGTTHYFKATAKGRRALDRMGFDSDRDNYKEIAS